MAIKKKKDFPGLLILVVGNSGSGKDSIMRGVIELYPTELKEEDFSKLALQGVFVLKWHIYGLDYGIPIEIDDWLKKGHPVLVNVSRSIIKKARSIYHNIVVVFIDAPFEITLKRIKERARESGLRLEERIQRARRNQDLPDADFIVDNSGELEIAIDQFLSYLIRVVKT